MLLLVYCLSFKLNFVKFVTEPYFIKSSRLISSSGHLGFIPRFKVGLIYNFPAVELCPLMLLVLLCGGEITAWKCSNGPCPQACWLPGEISQRMRPTGSWIVRLCRHVHLLEWMCVTHASNFTVSRGMAIACFAIHLLVETVALGITLFGRLDLAVTQKKTLARVND